MEKTTTGKLPSEEKVWLKFYSEEALKQKLPELTCYGYLKEANKNWLKNTALYFYGNKISFGDLLHRIDKTADAFAGLGVKKGDVVSIISVAVVETICAIYALNKIGAAANMIDPRMDVTSISRMIQNSGSSITIVLDVAYPKVGKIKDEIKQRQIIVQFVLDSLPPVKRAIMSFGAKRDIPFDDVVIKWNHFLKYGKNVQAEEAPYVGDAVVAITHTGGTTGFPKGVMLTNDSMNAVSLNFRYAGLVYNEGDRFLGIIPVFTSYGMVCGMHMPLSLGLELAPIPNFKADSFGKLIRTLKPNHVIATPAFYEMMMDSKDVKGLDMSFLTTMGSGGDTMNVGLERKLDRFMKKHNIPYPLAQGYGMSEVSAAASFNVNNIYRHGSVGIPSVTTTIGIFDPETGEELGYGQHGEVCITGPSNMKGYFNQEEETAFVMRKHEDGKIWVHSGDIGYLDEDGFLYIIGRVKRMITRFDGHKVFPINIEAMVTANENVHNSCVIGVNDRGHSQGQYPLVIIEPDHGADKKALCREIFEECQEVLEERGRPVAVLAVEKIPLTGSGKNDYRFLEKEYTDFDYTSWDPGQA